VIAGFAEIFQKKIYPRPPRQFILRLMGYVGLALLGLVIRLWNLGTESLWIDEAYSISLAQYNIFDIVRGTAADQHPPLYYLLLHLWLLLGTSVKFARLLSVILGVVHICLVVRIGEIIGNVKFGLIAGFVLTILPMHVWYSQEARMYMLLALLTTAATLELLLVKRSKVHWLRYFLYISLSFYTHYFTIFVVIGHAIFALLRYLVDRRAAFLVGFTSALLSATVSIAPWLPITHVQIRHHTMPWIQTPTFRTLRDVTLRILFGDNVLAQFHTFLWPMFYTVLLFLLLGGLFAATKHRFKRTHILLMLLWTFVPLTAIFLVSLFYPIFQYKQHLIIAAPLVVSFVIAASSLPRRVWFIPIIITATLQMHSLRVQQNTLIKDNWKALASYLEVHIQEQDSIFANPAAVKLPLEIYSRMTVHFEGYPPYYSILTGGWEGDIADEESVILMVRNIPVDTLRIWFIEFFPSLWDPNQQFDQVLSPLGTLAEDQFFGNIRLRLYVLDPIDR